MAIGTCTIIIKKIIICIVNRLEQIWSKLDIIEPIFTMWDLSTSSFCGLPFFISTTFSIQKLFKIKN